jgi:hypothetical protein
MLDHSTPGLRSFHGAYQVRVHQNGGCCCHGHGNGGHGNRGQGPGRLGTAPSSPPEHLRAPYGFGQEPGNGVLTTGTGRAGDERREIHRGESITGDLMKAGDRKGIGSLVVTCPRRQTRRTESRTVDL